MAPVPIVSPAIEAAFEEEEHPTILVDDVGHPSDLVDRLRRALPRRASEHDDNTRAWLAKNFFESHIERYTVARQKAPIYWQLATTSGSYSIWCYYHRLTRDTFFQAVNDYVAPKADHEEIKLNTLRQKTGPNPSNKQRKEINVQETFVAEIRAFLSEVKRIAPLWNPNLHDGVIINFAPLWRLVPQHKAWQKECKKVWDKVVKGTYDWTHLAIHLWPERVVPKCAKDRSLAIAHGLEEEFWYEDENGKWKPRKVTCLRIDELIAERSSTAVKAALESLLTAPAPSSDSKRQGHDRGAT